MISRIKENSGFTLIETLVTINLSFIAVSLVFSFFLFTQKFISSSISRLEGKNNLYNPLNIVEQEFRQSDQFEIRFLTSSTKILFNNNDQVEITSDSITFFDLWTEDIELSKLIIRNWDNKKFMVENGKLSEYPLFYFEDEKVLHSQDIRLIELMILKDKKEYRYEYSIPPVALRRFKNI